MKKYGLLLVILFLGILGGLLIDRRFFKKEKVVVQNKTEITDEESVVTRVVDKSTNSVVTVSINKEVLSTIDLWNRFFGGGESTESGKQKIEQDIGTGFVVSGDGLIVTNKHVVADTTAKYNIVLGKDEIVEVVNIYRDPINDLAILKINKNNLTPVDLGDSNQLKVGQTVIAIGTALGEFRSTVTKGVISGLGRGIVAGAGIDSEKLENVIQTDAAINPGNSGGPLFDSSGKVIGVNVAVSQNGQSIGFALPINLAKESIENFKKTGEFERPYLGIGYKIISKEIAAKNNLVEGAYVQTIEKGSPAEKSGLIIGDIITEFDGQKITDDEEKSIAKIVNQKKIGDELKISLVRYKKEISLEVKLGKKL